MAEAITDSGHMGPEDDINFLEIDFDEGTGTAVPNDKSSPAITNNAEATGDDLDFQIEEFEVVDETDDQTDHGAAPSGGDFTPVELAVPHSNKAESEIGYDEEEHLKAETSGLEFEAAGQQQRNDENVGSTDNVDEIDYEDGDFDAIQENNGTTESQAAMAPFNQEEVSATEPSARQALDETVDQEEPAASHIEADDRSTHEPSEPDQHVFDKDDRISHTGGYQEDSATIEPASEASDVMVLYNGVKYELCASVHNEDPETYFFASTDEMDAPLSQFFGLLRDVIKDEIEPSDDLVMKIPQLELEFSEDVTNEFLSKHTLRNILDLYRRFKYNDGEDAEHSQLLVHLVIRPNCQERYAMLVQAADAGRGWSEFFDTSDGSDSSSGHLSDQILDDERAGTSSGEDQTGGTSDDLQHETVEVVEGAFFYDDTNDDGDHEIEHMFEDQIAEDLGHDIDTMLNEGYELAGELEDDVELDQMPDRFDDNIEDDPSDVSHQPYIDQDGTGLISHADTSNEDVSVAADADYEGADKLTGGNGPESFDEEAASALETSGTLASDSQVHYESVIQSEAGAKTAHDSVPRNDLEDGDDNIFAVNDSSNDMEGLTAYDEAANNEPLPSETHTQKTDSHDTSTTSTINGDEITYEEENAALPHAENRTHEDEDDTIDNVDEIDWGNDGAEDVAVAEDPTNAPSPSGLSVKRGREEDDLISLDDENDAKRRKI